MQMQETNEIQPGSQNNSELTSSSGTRSLTVLILAVLVIGLCAAGGYAIYQYFTKLTPAATFETATSYEECIKLGKSTVQTGKPGSCTTENGEHFEEYIPPTVDVTSSSGGIESFETATTQVPNPQLMETKKYTIDIGECVPGTIITSDLTNAQESESISVLSQSETECNLVYKNSSSTSQTVCAVPRTVEVLNFITMPYGGFHIAPLSPYCN